MISAYAKYWKLSAGSIPFVIVGAPLASVYSIAISGISVL